MKSFPHGQQWPEAYKWIAETFGKPTRTQSLSGGRKAAKWLYLNSREASALFAKHETTLHAARNASDLFIPLDLSAFLHAVTHRNSPQASVILYWQPPHLS